MNLYQCFRFLRPSYSRVHDHPPESKRVAYLQFYAAVRRFSDGLPLVSTKPLPERILSAGPRKLRHSNREVHQGHGVRYGSNLATYENNNRQHINESPVVRPLKYPRMEENENALTCADFRNRYSFLNPNESHEGERVTLRGRMHSLRIAGSKLFFVDIVQDGFKVQGICNLRRLEILGTDSERFEQFYHRVRRGDIISITGTPSRTKRGELSLDTRALPEILTPIIASMPTTLDDPETRIRNRHADLLINERVADTLRLRSHIVQYLRNFLLNDNFLEVQTPILADRAGGAIARPFLTTAVEFQDRQLSLRIAPEIWLKRLVLGGMDRIFEIGPAFRNEGLDLTHNPEFTTCEFYKSFANIEELITISEKLISGLALHVNTLTRTRYSSLEPLDIGQFTSPFKRIAFIPALEAALGRGLPDLGAECASNELVSLFSELSIPLPSSPTLPRLLDKLSSHYLESQCTNLTFITHPPACLAPLAKSFHDPLTNQLVSARAELFVQNRELANMYEEENSPSEQRRKFIQQSKWRDDENLAVTDENYLEALEWALPPTGGWGCGIDRLCMLFSGSNRISDVLCFGTLKNVVGLSHRTSAPQ